MRPKRRRPNRPEPAAGAKVARAEAATQRPGAGGDKAARPKSSKPSKPSAPPADERIERGAKVPEPPGPAPDPKPQQSEQDDQEENVTSAADPRVQELEAQISRLSEKLEGMSQEREQVKGVADRFQGMEDRMKSLLQLSEILSIRYNPFLEEEEASLYDDRDPTRMLPERRQGAEVVPTEGPEETPPPQAPRLPSVERHEGAEVVPMEDDGPPEPTERPESAEAAMEPPEVIERVPESKEAPAPGDAEAQQEAPEAPAAPTAQEAATAEPEAAREAPAETATLAPEPSDDDGMVAVAHELLGRPETPAVEVAWNESLEEIAHADEGSAQAAEAPNQAPSEAPVQADARQEPSIASEPPAHDTASSEPERRPPRPEPRQPAATAERAQQAAPASAPSVQPVAAPGDARQAFHVLSWFERLAEDGDPAEIHLFVDHYARLGWIPPERVAWMQTLAEGIAPRRDDLHWDDLRLTGPELARMHRDNLQFLERLFRRGWPEDDPAHWGRQADHYFGGA